MAAAKQGDTTNQPETPLPPGWQKAVSPNPDTRVYFVNHNDNYTTWKDPRIYDPEPEPQGPSVLEYIIRRYDFVNAAYSENDHLRKELYSHWQTCGREGSSETLRACLTALQEKICVMGFPPPHSVGEGMTDKVLKLIEEVMSVCVTDRRVSEETCQGLWFEFLLSLLQYGPGSSAAYLINEKLLRIQNMESFLAALDGEKLTMVINSLKDWHYVPEDPKKFVHESQSYYWGVCIYKLLKIILGNYKSKKVYKPTVHQQFLELYLSYFTKITEVPDDHIHHLEYAMKRIETAYSDQHDGNPYQVLTKPDILRRHWKSVESTICSNKFKENHVDVSVEIVSLMVDCIIEKEWTVELWDEVVHMMKSYFLTKDGVNRPRVLSRILHLVTVTEAEVYDNNPEIMDNMLVMFTEIVQKKPEIMPWAYYYITVLSEKSSARKGSEKKWFPLMKVMMKSMHRKGVYRCRDTFRQKKFMKIWNWKQNYQEALDIIEPIGEVHLHLNGDDKDERLLENCGNTIYTLLEQFKFAKISEKLHGYVAEMAMTMMEKRSKLLCQFVERFVREISLESNQEVIPGLMKRFAVLFYDRDYIWDDYNTYLIGTKFMEKALEAYSIGKEIPDEVNQILIKMFLWAMQTEDLDYVDMDFRQTSLYGLAASEYLESFVRKHIGTKTSDVCLPLIPAIVKQLKHEEKILMEKSQAIVYIISVDDYKLLHGHLGALVTWYKETLSAFALRALWKPFEESDGFTTPDFNVIMEAIEEDTDNSKVFTHGMLLKLMAERQAELFTREHIDWMIKRFLDDKLSQYNVLTAFGEIIACQPQLFGDNMIKHVLQNPNLDVVNAASVQIIAVNLGLKKKEMADTILQELVTLTQSWTDPNHQISLLDAIRILGAKYGVETLKLHRKYFEDLQKYGKTSPVKDTSAAIVNAMDGVSMEGIITDVIQTKRKVKVLDKKVTQVETVVSEMKTEVDKQGKDIKTFKSGLETVEKRVDVVEKGLDETKVRVEEIDNKTMSNAPAWSRDLTKLMNPKSDHDWRLLAQRLGYSLNDIKAWATHSDPCMAVLSEWYTTHKTAEATHAVLNILQDMNRLDAVVIVENAMKAVEDVVEEAHDYTTPPPIFLSYQWGHQNEVKLLRQHLLMAGYECWMDVGQMGGGDKLFEKIDNGIRGSKVIICCVSEKYAKSPNCNREVNLSVNLGKPMIPLLMEKMAWPPKGSMGPIFSEYLFVRFFQRGGEETANQCYWPVQKFREILMQLNIYKIMPDESRITEEYKNWWVPVTEESIITTKSNNGGQSTAITAVDKEETSKSPDVFLSYQWGKQTQIKQLYKRLCELGLTCWMDIYQMGGGDSLYDKIDRGVRGCKIVLSCVTTKYAVSANCRREVSLADSIEKPVVPLLLEKMDWPPSGPMSTVLSQFRFIDFSHEEEPGMLWTGDKFENLLAEIMEFVPTAIGNVKYVKKNEVCTTDVTLRTLEKKGNETENIQTGGQEKTQQKPELSTSNTSNIPASTVEREKKQNIGEKDGPGKSDVSIEAEGDDQPPSYDSLFSQSSSGTQTTAAKQTSSKTRSKPNQKQSSTILPPPYLYRHQYVETPPQPTTKPQKEKSSSCVLF
ncbi:uncharacterized protein LOC132557685 [Ylistrum balloti]|uniref:uncharacterized protein LOC132557685 n=1 Tax=Ylistrum balloti TaxID=509963 RepID=UPI002905D89B|nr:uncharacterized protein LOC132557685 [Ylistrum balloti]